MSTSSVCDNSKKPAVISRIFFQAFLPLKDHEEFRRDGQEGNGLKGS